MLVLSGCKKKNEPIIYLDKYTFINQSSYKVTVDIYGTSENGRVMNENYSILRNESLILYSSVIYYPPFWLNLIPEDSFYTIISNGVVKVVQKPDDPDSLYHVDSYKLIADNGYLLKEYAYVLTDEFFKGGTPIK